MSYTKTTNFGAKDALPSGDPDKIVKGSEINTEFNNIQTAISTLTSTVNGLSGGTSVSGITYTAGTQLIGTNTDKIIYAPNPGVAFGYINGQFKSSVNGASINLRNGNNNTQFQATWVTIGHST